MAFQNRITLTGFTGTDAQVRTSKNNRTFAALSIATKRAWRDKQTNEYVSRTEWHRVIAWGKRADFAQRLAKGSHVKLDDELRFRSYIGNDNIRRHVSEVYVGSICKLDRAARPAQALLPQLANINAAMPS